MNDFGDAWDPDDVMAVKQRLLRRLFLIWRETAEEELESLDADLQVLLGDVHLAERLSTEFSWAETSELILASRFFRVPIHVWVLYPGRSESILALAMDPPGWSPKDPVYLWNIVTENGRGDHYCALEPFAPEPRESFPPMGGGGLLYAALSLGCLAGMVQAMARAQR